MLTKSRAAVVFALQTWLAETPEQRKNASTPSYYSVGMACMLPLSIHNLVAQQLTLTLFQSCHL